MKSPDRPWSRDDLAAWVETAGSKRWARRQNRRPALESLEPRALLTTVTEYPISPTTALPTAITTGSDGDIWFIEQSGNALGRINSSTHAITTFSNGLPANAQLAGLTSGPGGDLWFTESGLTANAVGKFNPNNTSQAIQNFGTSAGLSANSVPTGITSAGGDLWFTQPLTDQIGKLDPTTGHITEYAAPANMSGLSSQIILGPDRNLWFEEFGSIGILNPNTASPVPAPFNGVQVPLPSGSKEQPLDLTVGPNNDVWYGAGILNSAETAFGSYAIGFVNSSLQSADFSESIEPYALTAGPDGKIWFVTPSIVTVPGAINQINTATGAITQTPTFLTHVVAVPDPVGITAGPDGNVWFTDAGGAAGEVNLNVPPQFVVTAAPTGVVAGQGFGLTVTAEYGSGIVDPLFNGSVTISLANAPTGGSSTLGGTHLTVTAVDGVATFSGLSLDKAVAGYTLHAASSAAGAPAAVTTSGFSVTAAAATKLLVTTQPPSNVTVGQGFGFTVVAEDQFDNVATGYAGAATVGLVTNTGTVLNGNTTINFSPAGSSPGYATFGLSINNDGTAYKLGVSSGSLSGVTTNPFDVTGTLPPPPTITGESVVMTPQKFNNKHKKVGKPTLLGYMITFSTAMDQTALSSPSSYVIDLKSIKTETVKIGKRKVKQKVTVLTPTGFSVSQVTSNSVTLALAGKPTFPKGGQITVFASSVDNTSGVFLAQNGILPIGVKGKSIS
jgi:streptogramin lyase